MNTRPLSIVHLVFGLVFLGVTALWVVGVATDADSGDLARLVPAILIGAGVIGLGATLVNARGPRRSTDVLAGVQAYDAGLDSGHDAGLDSGNDDTNDSGKDDTTMLDHEEQR
jgi:hypothetical protein